MASVASKRILLAPLDWGLGHTSRCLPLIKYLQGLGHHVIVAGNDWQRQFITKSCPGVETIHLDGYDISYSKKAGGFMFAMFRQIPKLLGAIRRENGWLIEQSAKLQLDGIISDNRYGMFHKRIPSVVMTHQLEVRTGLGKVADDVLRRMHYKYLQRFKKCWVVDTEDGNSLGGKLSHPKALPDNATYIGLLSQFDTGHSKGGEHLLMLLSGPEPQRTILSKKLWQQVQGYDGKVVFIEGSEKVTRPPAIPGNISWHARLTKPELQPLLERASMVICRSGYSTLMDLTALGNNAIIIPTPGQTEQGYLARHLHKEGVYMAAAQSSFDLSQALASAKLFPFKKLSLQHSFNDYKAVIDNWLSGL